MIGRSIVICAVTVWGLCCCPSLADDVRECELQGGGTCNRHDVQDEDVGLLQAKIGKHALNDNTSTSQICKVGDHVHCPFGPGRCHGEQCCPGDNGGPTFPCPSAPAGWGKGYCQSTAKVEDCLEPGPSPAPAPAPPAPAPAPAPPAPSPGTGTTVLTVVNNDFDDGVAFCRGPLGVHNVFQDAAMTEPIAGSALDCSFSSSPAAQEWGEGVPQGVTLAIGLKRGESQNLYIAADGKWASGTCWFQDATSNQKATLAKGPSYQSQFEFTITESGGVVSFDVTSVEGVSGGLTMTYTSDLGAVIKAEAVPDKFDGDTLQIVQAPRFGFPTVLSNKWTEGACSCSKFSPDSADCNTDACYAGCPGSLANNPCGQHRCREYYAKQYEASTTYCGWLYKEKAKTYCWAMDEWLCTDATCGYGGADQPAQDCSSAYPAKFSVNTYSCGHGTNLPSGTPGVKWWPDVSGCVGKVIEGVPTNPQVRRSGGTVEMVFKDLPWLHAK